MIVVSVDALLAKLGVEHGRVDTPAPVSPGRVEVGRVHKAELLRHVGSTLRVRPANHSEPCPHPRVFLRADASRLCIVCWQALAPGGTVWAPEAAPVRCIDGQHEAYPERPSMPGIRQCRHCPSVWREDQPPPGNVGRHQAPCPACGCTWSWPTDRNTWRCAGCVTAVASPQPMLTPVFQEGEV